MRGRVGKACANRGPRSPSKGLTLIELLIALAVITILAAIAIPSYFRHVEKSGRAEAKSTLLALAGRMEHYFADSRSYEGASVAGLLGSDKTEHGGYTLSIQSVGVDSYTIIAQPDGRQAGDACGSFTLSSTGAKGVEGGKLPISKCW